MQRGHRGRPVPLDAGDLDETVHRIAGEPEVVLEAVSAARFTWASTSPPRR